MLIKVKDLDENHPAVKAAHHMVRAHWIHETLNPAVYEVSEAFPELDPQLILAMWIAVNAKENDG
jgi:hypothetical protein